MQAHASECIIGHYCAPGIPSRIPEAKEIFNIMKGHIYILSKYLQTIKTIKQLENPALHCENWLTEKFAYLRQYSLMNNLW
jgi:hypothetical protein